MAARLRDTLETGALRAALDEADRLGIEGAAAPGAVAALIARSDTQAEAPAHTHAGHWDDRAVAGADGLAVGDPDAIDAPGDAPELRRGRARLSGPGHAPRPRSP